MTKLWSQIFLLEMLDVTVPGCRKLQFLTDTC